MTRKSRLPSEESFTLQFGDPNEQAPEADQVPTSESLNVDDQFMWRNATAYLEEGSVNEAGQIVRKTPDATGGREATSPEASAVAKRAEPASTVSFPDGKPIDPDHATEPEVAGSETPADDKTPSEVAVQRAAEAVQGDTDDVAETDDGKQAVPSVVTKLLAGSAVAGASDTDDSDDDLGYTQDEDYFEDYELIDERQASMIRGPQDAIAAKREHEEQEALAAREAREAAPSVDEIEEDEIGTQATSSDLTKNEPDTVLEVPADVEPVPEDASVVAAEAADQVTVEAAAPVEGIAADVPDADTPSAADLVADAPVVADPDAFDGELRAQPGLAVIPKTPPQAEILDAEELGDQADVIEGVAVAAIRPEDLPRPYPRQRKKPYALYGMLGAGLLVLAGAFVGMVMQLGKPAGPNNPIEVTATTLPRPSVGPSIVAENSTDNTVETAETAAVAEVALDQSEAALDNPSLARETVDAATAVTSLSTEADDIAVLPVETDEVASAPAAEIEAGAGSEPAAEQALVIELAAVALPESNAAVANDPVVSQAEVRGLALGPFFDGKSRIDLVSNDAKINTGAPVLSVAAAADTAFRPDLAETLPQAVGSAPVIFFGTERSEQVVRMSDSGVELDLANVDQASTLPDPETIPADVSTTIDPAIVMAAAPSLVATEAAELDAPGETLVARAIFDNALLSGESIDAQTARVSDYVVTFAEETPGSVALTSDAGVIRSDVMRVSGFNLASETRVSVFVPGAVSLPTVSSVAGDFRADGLTATTNAWSGLGISQPYSQLVNIVPVRFSDPFAPVPNLPKPVIDDSREIIAASIRAKEFEARKAERDASQAAAEAASAIAEAARIEVAIAQMQAETAGVAAVGLSLPDSPVATDPVSEADVVADIAPVQEGVVQDVIAELLAGEEPTPLDPAPLRPATPAADLQVVTAPIVEDPVVLDPVADETDAPSPIVVAAAPVSDDVPLAGGTATDAAPSDATSASTLTLPVPFESGEWIGLARWVPELGFGLRSVTQGSVPVLEITDVTSASTLPDWVNEGATIVQVNNVAAESEAVFLKAFSDAIRNPQSGSAVAHLQIRAREGLEPRSARIEVPIWRSIVLGDGTGISVSEINGKWVTEVVTEGRTAEDGLKQGDILLRDFLTGSNMRSPTALDDLLAEMTDSGETRIEFAIMRDGELSNAAVSKP